MKKVKMKKKYNHINDNIDDFVDYKYVLVHARDTRIYIGEVVKIFDTEIILKNARRILSWGGDAVIAQVTQEGITKPDAFRVTVTISKIMIKDWMELISCQEEIFENILNTEPWKL